MSAPSNLDAFRAHLEEAGLSPHSIRGYCSVIRQLLAESTGDEAACRAFAKRRLQDATPGTTSVVTTALHRWADFRETSVNLPKGRKRPAAQREALDREGLAAYQDAVALCPLPVVRTVLQLLPLTGMRIHELCKVERKDLIATGDRLGIHVVGKGSKPRFVPLGSRGRAILRQYLTFAEDSPFLFPAPSNADEPVPPDTVRKHLRELRGGETWSPHVLRHTYATLALEEGVDLISLKALLGHTRTETTAIYAHPTARGLEKMVEKIEG